jgi:hypothetical protein
MAEPRPLRLSDAQLQPVRRAAALLAPRLRGKFLQSIARELADVDPIDDEAVKWAVDAVLNSTAARW